MKLEVKDADHNTAQDTMEKVSVTVKNSKTNEERTVELTETGLIPASSMPVGTADKPTAGKITVQGGDELIVTYLDTLTSAGSEITRKATATAVRRLVSTCRGRFFGQPESSGTVTYTIKVANTGNTVLTGRN